MYQVEYYHTGAKLGEKNHYRTSKTQKQNRNKIEEQRKCYKTPDLGQEQSNKNYSLTQKIENSDWYQLKEKQAETSTCLSNRICCMVQLGKSGFIGYFGYGEKEKGPKVNRLIYNQKNAKHLNTMYEYKLLGKSQDIRYSLRHRKNFRELKSLSGNTLHCPK